MTREEFFNKLTSGAKWDVGVSIARTNPLPLDANSVFESVEALTTYVTTNALAYPGQLVSVLGEAEVAAYQIQSVGETGTFVKLAASTATGDIEGDLIALTNRVATAEGKLTALEGIVGDATAGLVKDVADNKSAVEANASAIDGHSTRLTAVEGKVTANETAIAGNTANIAAIDGRVTTVESAVATLNGTGEGSVTKTVNDAIDAFAQEVSENGTIDTIKEIVDWVAEHGSEAAEMVTAIEKNESDIATLNGDGEGSVNKKIADAKTATLSEVDTKISTATAPLATKEEVNTAKSEALDAAAANTDTKIAEAKTNLESQIDSVETSVTNLSGRIDDIVAEGGEPNQINNIKVNGVVQSIADDKSVDITVPTQLSALEGYTELTQEVAKKVDAIEGKSLVNDTLITKLEGLETINSVKTDEFVISDLGELSINAIAQDKVIGLTDALAASGKIDVVKVGGTALTITDKTVDIPVAGTALGVVKSSTAENGVAVAADGTMSVNTLNVNKLVQTDGEELVLNGGKAE